MSEAMRTAVLIDGSPDPPALRIREGERQKYINQGRAGQTPRNFEFVKPLSVKVEGEDEPRTVYVYRLVGAQFGEGEFDAMAMAEADKHLNPEKYARRNEAPDAMRSELDEYRRRFGPLKKEA